MNPGDAVQDVLIDLRWLERRLRKRSTIDGGAENAGEESEEQEETE
jgi:hypothetical protein